jgi:formate dehydrogenase assembly factor FdhD
MVQNAATMGAAAIITAISAPTALAIRTVEVSEITLVGSREDARRQLENALGIR